MNTAIRALAASGLCALAACLPMNPEVQGASTTSGDFATLDCVELATAEGSIRQRIASIDPATGQVFGVQTPEGRPVAEQRLILQSAAGDLARIRENRNCVESAPIVTAAEALSQPEAEAPVVFGPGLYLQVATFAVAAHRDAAMAAYLAEGLSALSAPVSIVGRAHDRVLVGPLHSRDEIARVDAVSRKLGLRDTFFVRS